WPDLQTLPWCLCFSWALYPVPAYPCSSFTTLPDLTSADFSLLRSDPAGSFLTMALGCLTLCTDAARYLLNLASVTPDPQFSQLAPPVPTCPIDIDPVLPEMTACIVCTVICGWVGWFDLHCVKF
ncbi:unnamed protein product, partial [Staurois parvus]